MKEKITVTFFIVFINIFYLIIPDKIFKDPVCTVITDSSNVLLGASIAKDGQYRFPYSEKVPEKFKKAILSFEDKRFNYHWGIDPLAIFRAIKYNFKHKKVVNGGSTLTMQVIRLSRKGKERTVKEKIIEMFLAFRLECSYRKKTILALYASNAPFGGNIVGLNAASWRYFGRNPENLSWAETATLAVLPNSPSLIHPGKNRTNLLKKRNILLHKLYEDEVIDKETYQLSLEEPIPDKPKEFPAISSHLLNRAAELSDNQSEIQTTISSDLQDKVYQIVEKHYKILSGNNIHNVAVLVVEVETGNVVAYVGNISDFSDKNNGKQVDIIKSKRSTGSILKPFLYTSMLTEGDILPNSLVFDIPTQFGGFTPSNYNKGYDGAVPANKSLARSLNIPAVRMLKDYGVEKFHRKLQQIGLTSLNKPPSHYGLSLILGGCEASLWDITGIYASMARSLNNYKEFNGKYLKSDYHEPNILKKNLFEKSENSFWTKFEDNSYYDASAIWLTFNALLEVERPEADSEWRKFSSSEKIAWKTGTSFGFRDAWAVGVTPKYVVGVWAGNADGEGRAGLVGVYASAPILFDVFDVLQDSPSWFEKPLNDMIQLKICRKSGYIASDNCEETDLMYVPKTGGRFSVCPFHKLIHLDKSEKFRVNSDCESLENMISKTWFVLPPAVENFYKSKNASYKYLPPFRDDCNSTGNPEKNMEILYPYENLKIYVPIELSGIYGRTVFKAAHRKSDVSVFWYIDDKIVGTTKDLHQLELRPSPGRHVLTLVDENGEKIVRNFEIINREN